MVLRSSAACSFEVSRATGSVGVELGVAQVARAVGVRAAHRLRDAVDVGRADPKPSRARSYPSSTLSIVQERDPAGADGRHREHVVSAVGAAQGHAAQGPVRRQVGAGDEAAAGLHLLLDEPRGLALVEPGRPVVGDPLQRAGEVGLLQRGRRARRARPPARTARPKPGTSSSPAGRRASERASPSVTTKPSRASRIAGSTSRRQGSLPCSFQAMCRPATVPGTPTARWLS